LAQSQEVPARYSEPMTRSATGPQALERGQKKLPYQGVFVASICIIAYFN
jgi:hypothetical protein